MEISENQLRAAEWSEMIVLGHIIFAGKEIPSSLKYYHFSAMYNKVIFNVIKYIVDTGEAIDFLILLDTIKSYGELKNTKLLEHIVCMHEIHLMDYHTFEAHLASVINFSVYKERMLIKTARYEIESIEFFKKISNCLNKINESNISISTISKIDAEANKALKKVNKK